MFQKIYQVNFKKKGDAHTSYVYIVARNKKVAKEEAAPFVPEGAKIVGDPAIMIYNATPESIERYAVNAPKTMVEVYTRRKVRLIESPEDEYNVELTEQSVIVDGKSFPRNGLTWEQIKAEEGWEEALTETAIDKLERSFPLIKFTLIEDDYMTLEDVADLVEKLKGRGLTFTYTSEFYGGVMVSDTELRGEVMEDIFHSYWEDEINQHNNGFTANHEYKLGYQYVEPEVVQ